MIITNISSPGTPTNIVQSLSSGLGQFSGGFGRQSPKYNGGVGENLQASITTTGRKVEVSLVPVTVTEALPFVGTSWLRAEVLNDTGGPANTSLTVIQYLMRNGVDRATKTDSISYPSAPDGTLLNLEMDAIKMIDSPPAGTHLYRFEWEASGSPTINTVFMRFFKLVLREI